MLNDLQPERRRAAVRAHRVPPDVEDARDPEARPEVLKRLATSEHPAVLELVAAPPNTPASTVVALAGRLHPWLKERAAAHPALPAEVLRELAGHWYDPVREAVAAHAKTPPEILDTLAGDEVWTVRQALLRNRAAPETVRRAADPESSAEHLADLAAHPLLFVRELVAAREDAPLPMLEALLQDPYENVRREAAANPALSPERLARLVREDPSVRWAVFQNPALTNELRLLLAREDEPFDLRAVAVGSLTDPAVLWTFADDPEPLVREAVAFHRAAPDTVRAARDGDTDVDELAVLAVHPALVVRELVAAHPRLTPDLLGLMANDPHPAVRLRVAEHDALPVSVRRRLMRDVDEEVREVATGAQA